MEKILVFHTYDELIQAAADQFISTASDAIEDQGCFSIVLSGGSTPLPLYKYLADHRGDDLSWDKIHFFWGDERPVPPDHLESNFNQANLSLLKPRSIPAENIHRIQAELSPPEAAQRYQEEILSYFQNNPPRFDLILLGMGSDGHTASLFPGTELVSGEISDQKHLVAANWVPKLDTWRITFTPHLINSAVGIIFLVSGSSKAKPLQRVLNGAYQPEVLPSQLIDPDQGNLFWYVDREAAAELSDLSLE